MSEATATNDWYHDWVRLHCRVTGLAAEEQLLALRGVVVRNWTANAGELAAVTERWAANGVQLRWLSDLNGTLRRMLLDLRAEVAHYAPPEPAAARGCRWCGGRGLVVVPIPECVENDPLPRLVPYAGGANVQTGTVLCDDAYCAAGAEARRREDARDTKRHLSTFGAYCIRLDVPPDALLGLLAEHERARRADVCARPEFAPGRDPVRVRFRRPEAA